MFPFIQLPGTSSDCCDLSDVMESDSSQFPQDPGMHFIQSHRLVIIQLHQVILNLLFAYRGRDFTSPTSTQKIRDVREVGSLTAGEGWDKEYIRCLSLLHISGHQFIPLSSKRGTFSSAFIFWSKCILESLLVILHIPCQVLFQLSLGFPDTIPTHSNNITVLFRQVTCHCFHCLCISLLLLSLRSRSVLSHAIFQPALLSFLHTRIKSSCTLRKVVKECNSRLLHAGISHLPPQLSCLRKQLEFQCDLQENLMERAMEQVLKENLSVAWIIFNCQICWIRQTCTAFQDTENQFHFTMENLLLFNKGSVIQEEQSTCWNRPISCAH